MALKHACTQNDAARAPSGYDQVCFLRDNPLWFLCDIDGFVTLDPVEEPVMKIEMRLIVLCMTILITCGGCVSLGTEKRLAPGDLSSLAGRWTGYVQHGNFGRRAVELTIRPDGSYVSYHEQAGTVGVMTIVDGKVESRGQTGRVEHRSTASLYERNGKQILSGTGHSATGPYSFQYEKIQ